MPEEKAPKHHNAAPRTAETFSQAPVPSTLRIALGVAVLLAALIVCQGLCEGLESALPLVTLTILIGAIAVLICAIRYDAMVSLLGSVKLVVVLLTYLALACIASTFVLQQPGKFPRDETHQAARYQNYLSAQAPFIYKLCHPFRHFAVQLSPFHNIYTEILEKKFSSEYAHEKQKELIRSAQRLAEQKAIGEFSRNHPSFFEIMYDFIVFTRLDRAYSAWWFRSLAGLLLLNAFFCTRSRYRFRLSQTGFFLTHLGLILALIGAAIDSRWEQKGMMQFLAGENGKDRLTSFTDVYTQEEVPLGFALRTEYFKTEYHKTLQVSFSPAEIPESPHPIQVSRSYSRLRKGSRIVLDEGKVVITVEEIIPHAIFKDEMFSRSDEPNNPAIELLAKSEERPQFFRLYANDEVQNRYLDIAHRLHIKFVWFKEQADLQPGIAQFSAESPASLFIFTRDSVFTLRPIQKGDRFQHGENIVEVLECCGDYENKSDAPLKQREGKNPAARIKITSPDGKSEERWIFSKTPQHDKDSAVLMFLRWEPPDTVRYLIYGIGKGPLNVIKITGSKAIGPKPLATGQPIDTSGPGANMYVADLALDAAVLGVTAFQPPPDADPIARVFEDPSEQAIRLRIQGPDFDETTTLLANSQEQGQYERRGYFSLAYGDDEVKDYKAYLLVEDENNPSIQKKAQIVEVNHPLSYGGFTFYQETHDKKIPNFTGIKVTRDPGSALAQFGLIVMLAGIAFAFYVKPLLQKAK